MPLYRYEALDRTGNKVVGAMQVSDEQALSARLTSMGYRPVHVEAAGGAGRTRMPAAPSPVPAAAGTGVFAPAAPAAVPGPRSRLSADTRSVARMYHQLHLSFRAGMPAYQALTTVQGQIHHGALRQVLGEMGEGVRDGQLLSTLMERYPRVFSAGDVGMLRAAELGGFLPEALQFLADRHEQDDNTRRRLRIWVWFFHSNVLGLLLVLPGAFFLKESVGALAGPPGGPSPVMAGLAAAARAFTFLSVPLGALYFGFLAWFYQARNNPDLARRWHQILLRLPVVGKINFLRANAVFTRVLEQLTRAGVGAETAWQAAAAGVPNLFLSDRFGAMTPTVRATGKYSTAMQQVGLLDLTDVGMVATGESTGEVDQALGYLAARYEEDTRVALGASVVRGAISFTFYAFVLGAVALAIVAWCYGQGLFKLAEGEF